MGNATLWYEVRLSRVVAMSNRESRESHHTCDRSLVGHQPGRNIPTHLFSSPDELKLGLIEKIHLYKHNCMQPDVVLHPSRLLCCSMLRSWAMCTLPSFLGEFFYITPAILCYVSMQEGDCARVPGLLSGNCMVCHARQRLAHQSA